MNHLVMEDLKRRAKVDVLHVPFGGGGPAVQAVLADTSQITLLSFAALRAQIQAGKVKALAVTGAKRLPDLPQVPTVAESGGPAKGYEVSGWNTLVGPKGLSPAIQEKIRKDVAQALSGPDVKEKFLTFGYVPLNLDRPQFRKFIDTEAARYSAVIKRAKIELE